MKADEMQDRLESIIPGASLKRGETFVSKKKKRVKDCDKHNVQDSQEGESKESARVESACAEEAANSIVPSGNNSVQANFLSKRASLAKMHAAIASDVPRPEVERLLRALNLNFNTQLTKKDTANMLATIMTCNETQLTALLNNKRTPLVIRTIVKKLLSDSESGELDTVFKLWNRIFGKDSLMPAEPVQVENIEKGILPQKPVSREAYILIRDTLIK